jgi:hypothetical protein
MDQFLVGQEYDVGWRFGSMMLLEGWAEPVGFEEPRRRQLKGERQARAADAQRRATPRKKR